MTANEKLQYAVIGDFLGDAVTLKDARNLVNMYGLEKRHFSNAALGAAFETVMTFNGDDKASLYHEISKKLPAGECDKAMDNAANVVTDCEDHMRRIVDDWVKDRIDSIPSEAKRAFAGAKPTPQAYAAFCHERIDAAMPKVTGAKPKGVMTAKEFVERYNPADEEKKRLFVGDQGRWLAKEGALVLTSTSGAGKSVLAMQMGLSWACGKPWFGITPTRPLKIGIFQTEDDNATMYQNMMDCRKAGKWPELDFDLAMENFVLCDTLGLMGDSFIKRLAEVHGSCGFDLIIINPLQGVCAGTDIAKNAELTRFLREGLDGVVKGRLRGCQPCGLVLVHHTNKPTMTPRGYGVASPQFLEYAGAGGAELVNWMRAMLLLLEDLGKDAKPGHYSLIATKKGDWLGWPKPVNSSIRRPMKRIRHHDPEVDGGGRLMFWYEVDEAASAASSAAVGSTVEDDAMALAADLKQLPRTLADARAYAIEKLRRKRGEAAFNMVKGSPRDYGLVVKPTGYFNERVIGAKEDVAKYISTLAEKRKQNGFV